MSSLAKAGYKGLSLSGAGWLLPFHVGVYETLVKAGAAFEDIPIAGASGGALVAAGFGGGSNGDDMMRVLGEIGKWTEKNGYFGKLANPMREVLYDVLPADAHEK